MYVCICNAIRECDFDTAGRCVDGDAEAVYAAMGKRPQCGGCLEEADMMLAEKRCTGRRPLLAAA
jgi:bacterioferritin-associated ferredoxin